MEPTILRISRHDDGNPSRQEALEKAYGNKVDIVTVDIPYGNNPTQAVRDEVEKLTKAGREVIGVEAIAPMPVLAQLSDNRGGIGIPVLRSELARGEDGKAVVIGQEKGGRDILKISSFSVVDRISLITHELNPNDAKLTEEGGVVLRIAMADTNPTRDEAIKKGLGGENFEVVNNPDVRYGDRPSDAVMAAIKDAEARTGKKVIAVDAAAPMPVLSKLIDQKFGIHIPVLRAEFKRENGRAVIVSQDEKGRDILAIDHYKVVDDVVLETHELTAEDLKRVRGKVERALKK